MHDYIAWIIILYIFEQNLSLLPNHTHTHLYTRTAKSIMGPLIVLSLYLVFFV